MYTILVYSNFESIQLACFSAFYIKCTIVSKCCFSLHVNYRCRCKIYFACAHVRWQKLLSTSLEWIPACPIVRDKWKWAGDKEKKSNTCPWASGSYILILCEGNHYYVMGQVNFTKHLSSGQVQHSCESRALSILATTITATFVH